MRVIAFIEQATVIRKILEHLELCKTMCPVRPRSHAPPATGHDCCGNAWMPSAADCLTDTGYPADAYL